MINKQIKFIFGSKNCIIVINLLLNSLMVFSLRTASVFAAVVLHSYIRVHVRNNTSILLVCHVYELISEICIDCCFYFVIFTWIIEFVHEFAALFVPSINEVSTATLHSTIFLNKRAPTGQAANLERFLNKISLKLCDPFLRNDASGVRTSRQNRGREAAIWKNALATSKHRCLHFENKNVESGGCSLARKLTETMKHTIIHFFMLKKFLFF